MALSYFENNVVLPGYLRTAVAAWRQQLR